MICRSALASVLAAVVLAATASAVPQFTPPPVGVSAPHEYRPLSNGEMAQQGVWESWIQTFTALSAKQKAEVMRRHIGLCLASTRDTTDEQDALVKTLARKYAVEETYAVSVRGADPDRRAAFQQQMKSDMEQARLVLGDDVMARVFERKPPLSVLVSVRDAPTTGYHPMTNVEMARLGLWEWYVDELAALTPAQRAEAMRRHVMQCLDHTELTDEERALAKESLVFLTAETYKPGTPEERRAVQQRMLPLLARADAVMRPEIRTLIFQARPTFDILDQVRRDASVK